MSKSITIKEVAIPTPAAPTVTPQGTTGATAYSYKLVGRGFDGKLTAASPAGSTATGNAALTSGNKNHVTWVDPANVEEILIYRTVGGATQGLIGIVAAGTQVLDDVGLVGDGATPPATNTTGVPRGDATYLSGSSFTPGRTVGLYVNGQWAGVVVAGPYGAPPASGNFGAAGYGALSGALPVPNSTSIPTPGASTCVAMDMTDGTSATTPITTT